MTYKASLDKMAKWITAGTTILFTTAIVVLFLFMRSERYAFPIFTSFALIIYVGIFLYRPISYTLTKDNLIIHRPLFDVRIDREKIMGVEQLDNDKLAWSIRTFGVNGLFGYFGRFVNSKMGSMIWFATRKKNAVLIRTTDDKKIILTPNEAQKFVAAFGN